MKRYRFYIDYGSKKEKRKHSIRANRLPKEANCIAIAITIADNYGALLEGAVATFNYFNSDVSWGVVDREYLRRCCTKCSERLVRKLHPKLIEYLEYNN